MKVCTQCGEEKPATLEYFHAYKRSPDGVRSKCKVCRAKNHMKNREDRLSRRRKFYSENRERLVVENRESYQKFAENRREYARNSHWENRDRNIKRMSEYWSKNRPELNRRRRAKANESFHERYKKDPVFTLKHRVRSLVHRSLKNGVKSETLQNILGYSIDDLRAHIESQFVEGMSWEEFMNGNIHIDHIIPISYYNPSSSDDDSFKKCWDLSNLQPLWAKDNLSKGDKIIDRQ